MLVGAGCQLVLLAVAWTLPAVSEFDLVSDTVSELALGSHGYLQTGAFVVAGLGVLGFAYGMWRLTARIRGAATGAGLLAIYGFTAIVVAIFPTDRVADTFDVANDFAVLSAAGTVHVVAALAGFVCAVASMFVLTTVSWRVTEFRRAAPWSMMLPSGALALLFIQSPGPQVGLAQRVLVTVIAGWLVLHALLAYPAARTAARRP
jgi:hypothetical protein